MKLTDIESLWLVGCGAMGGALLARWRDAGLQDAAVTVVDPSPKGLPSGFHGTVRPDPPAETAQVVVLGIKPQLLSAVAPLICAALTGTPLILSMLAGIRLQTLEAFFPQGHLARIMPNTPVRIGQGVTGIFAPGIGTDHALINALMFPTGTCVWLQDESGFDALTAVSGSGPAYVFRFIEALAAAAESAGLDSETAERLALGTVTGAAALTLVSGKSPAALRQAVTSPNGTTEAGLAALDGGGTLSALLRSTVRAAAERSRCLGAEAEASLLNGTPA